MASKFLGIKAIYAEENNPSAFVTNAAGQRQATVTAGLTVVRADGAQVANVKTELGAGGVWFRDGDWIVLYEA